MGLKLELIITETRMVVVSLFVDDRQGSADLYPALVKTGIPTEMIRMPFGDFAFIGRGDHDRPLNIGIERKRLSDLVGSLRSDRLSGHQLPGMLGPEGAFDYSWIVVEGLYRVGSRGEILVKQKHKGSRIRRPEWVPLPGGMTASEMQKRVLTFELCGGCHVQYTNFPEDTVHFLRTLYFWWNDRSLDDHTSHLAAPQTPGIIALSPFRQAVMKWPGIGLRTSLAVETRFRSSQGLGSIVKAANASVGDWAGIVTLDRKGHGKRLGTAVAEKLVAFLKGEV